MIDIQVSRRIFNETYYPYLLDYENRYEIYYGGAGSGKSVFVAQKLLIKALSNRRRVLIVRKVARTLRDSVFQLMLNTLSQFHILERCSVNKTNFTIGLPNESQFLFYGLDDVEKMKSITGITDIWIEEATETNFDDFSQLDLRLRADVPNLQILLSFNPVSKANWCYKHWFENGTPKNTIIIKTTYKDNRFLPQDYINALEAMKTTNPTYYNIYALGEFCSLDKLVFNNWTIGTVEDTKDLELLIGLDFGFVNDATAFVVAYLDENNKSIYIEQEVYQTGLLNDQIAEIIKYMGFSKSVIIADSAEQKSIEEIKRAGVQRIRPAAKGQGSILQGIQKLQQYQLIVNPNCANMITELQNYSWKKDKSTNEYINEPVDAFNHLCDALRYSLQCLDNKQKLQTFSKSAFGL